MQTTLGQPGSSSATPASAPTGGTSTGSLQLVFERRGRDTVLRYARSQCPLKVIRAFELEDGRLLSQVLCVGPGLCAGDRWSVEITVEPGARAVVINQSATRVHGMGEGEAAQQSVVLHVHDGAQLEYYPGLTIPYPDSAYDQRLTAHVATSARFGLIESWAMGRIGRSEYLEFRRLSSHVNVSIADEPVYADALLLEPGHVNLSGWGLLEGHRYLAGGFWHGAALSAVSESQDPVLAIGPAGPQQTYLRALGNDGAALRARLAAVVEDVGTIWGLRPFSYQRFTS